MKRSLEKRLDKASKGEKLTILKSHLDNIYDTYSNLLSMIPEIEERIALRMTEGRIDRAEAWEKVLKELNRLKDRPKAMKLYYAKRMTSKIKKLRKKYPDE